MPAPSISIYATRCQVNYDFAKRVKTDAAKDAWYVVALFYSAVQAVDAFLLKEGKVPHNHASRFQNLKPYLAGTHDDVWDAFDDLFTISKTARYKPHLPIPDLAVLKAELQRQTVCQHFAPLIGQALPCNI